jgi:hypothetical protein
VGILVGAQLEVGANQPGEELPEGVGAVEREERGPLLRDGEVADAPALLVARDIVPVQPRLEPAHVLEEPLHHRGREELRHEEELVLIPVLALETALVQRSHRGRDGVGHGQRRRGRAGRSVRRHGGSPPPTSRKRIVRTHGRRGSDH